MKFRDRNDYTRRDFIKFAAIGTSVLTLDNSIFGSASEASKTKEMLVYIGTYTSGKSKSEGIYVYKLNLDSGELNLYKTVKNVVEPSYLTIDKDKKYLYAVNETVEYEGKKSGAVSAFAINQETGDLSFLNKQPSLGGAPCYIIVSENGKFTLVANYVGGNVAAFAVEAGGIIGAPVDLQQQLGTGPNKDRQEAAHAHSIDLDDKNRFAYSCDLGADKIYIYEFDKKDGKLKPNPAQEFLQARVGVGPRHLAFHPNGHIAFVINELDSSITALDWDKKRGTLRAIATVSTLPADFKGENTGAEIQISPNGKFLYGSNRGHDSISAFKIDAPNGNLELIENVSTQGKTPRNFVITPNGEFLLAANQNSDSVVVFRIDEKSGKLAPTGNTAQVPSPVCLKLMTLFS